MVHLAGYVGDSATYHPEFHHIRNVYAMDSAGGYTDIRHTFFATEDFWSRDCRHRSSQTGFIDDSYYVVYANGFPEGRIAYMTALKPLNQLFGTLWNQPGWHFRPPRSLKDTVCFVRLYMLIIHGLFEVSDHAAPYIGGDVQIVDIPPP